MSESILITATTKEEKYNEVLPQIYSLTNYENNLIANTANITAVLKEVFGFFWVGFYFVDSENELVLGPFQGPLACTRIRKGKGVCGTVFANAETLVVADIEIFAGHIACSSASKSEIVIPVIKDGRVVAILDVDSDKLNDFDEVDDKYLTEMCVELSKLIF